MSPVPFDVIYQGCINKVTEQNGVDFENKTQAKEALKLSSFLAQSVNCTVSLRAKNPFHKNMIRPCTFARDPNIYTNKTKKCTEMERKVYLSYAAFTRSNDSSQLFFNPLCAKCLHGIGYATRFDQCVKDFHIANPDWSLHGDRGYIFTPFSVLISFRKNTVVRLIAENEFGNRKFHDTVKCKNGEHFDIMKEKCLSLLEKPRSFTGGDIDCKSNCVRSHGFRKESSIMVEVEKSRNKANKSRNLQANKSRNLPLEMHIIIIAIKLLQNTF